ncbi:precorrin-6A reductase [Desulfotomaculum copahuensis]|uniref:Precorrin-6x reductase n=1 Tax=Desulfotomaculum copahuensis TaxID=1838280 RepID=A0A1B7LBG1_9FIRM|nr:precorrin-6A reductase [Desulfotomaculum copahuensis]OAT79877.1 precorrin-6x reductase [Desulfotomaculum copahuensis]
MLLVLYGTREARELISLLSAHGYRVMATARTAYGGTLAGMGGAVEVLPAPADTGEMVSALKKKGITLVLDATHPSPGLLSQMAREASNRLKLPFIRYERKETSLPVDPQVHVVDSWEEAVEVAAGLGNTVFLTTGSNNLEVFVRSKAMRGKRLVVRVLPEHRIIKKCDELGLLPRDIVALQGPFSARFNRAMFQAYRAEVVVTRESGGSTDAKIRAALGLKLPVVVIRRTPPPGNNLVHNYRQVLQLVRHYLGEPDD